MRMKVAVHNLRVIGASILVIVLPLRVWLPEEGSP